MRVKLLYFAKVKELVGLDDEIIDLPSSVMTFDDLKHYLVRDIFTSKCNEMCFESKFNEF
ncbi:MAG: hypothetical protein RIT47_1107 [Pseudomonadota bacterium]